MTTITVEVDGKSHQVTVDDSFTSLSPEQQEAEVQHIATQIGQNATSGGGTSNPSLVDKAADYLGLTNEMLAPAMGTVVGATTGAALGPSVGEGVDLVANKIAGKLAAPGVVPPEGVPGGVMNWYKEETGHPYAGGKTKEEAYAKGQRAAGQPVASRGANIKIRKGNLGINNQLEPQKPTLPQKAAANIINAEKVNTPGFTRRMLGMGVAGGELGNLKEELSKGNYGRAALSGLGALGGAASQSKIKPVRAVGTGLSAIVPTIQMMLPESEDNSNINKAAGGAIRGYANLGAVKKLGAGITDEGGSKIMEILKEKMAPLYIKSKGIPAPLPRAPQKSDKELQAFAERMAPQVRGDFVRAPGKTTSVAGKTLEQFEREKGLQHDIREAFPLATPPAYSDAMHKGKVKIGIAGDQTLTGKDVYGIAGNELSEPSRQYGGALYPAAHPQGWASEKGAAKGVQNSVNTTSAQYGDADVLGQYLKMGPEANNYSVHNADAIIKSIDPNQVKQLDKLNQLIRGRFPDFPGLENQTELLDQVKQNPSLRKYLDYLVQTKKVVNEHNLPSGQDIRHALSEPDLRNLEIGATGKSIMQMQPGAKITPSSEATTTTYSHDIPGTYMGGTQYPRPYALDFPDSHLALQNKIKSVQDFAKEAVEQNPDLDPQAAIKYAKKYGNQGFGGFRLSQPRQIIDQQHIDETGKYEDYMKKLVGFAPGGRVAQAAIDAFKAKFTPGFYHGSPSNRIKAFDPTKSNKPEEYITPGVTFLTQNPSFAHDYTPMRGTASKMVGQPDQYATGATIYPVSANLGKKFDFDTPEGKAIAKAFLKEKMIPNQGEQDAARWLAGMQDEHNTWKSLEHPDFLQHLKDTGHDSFAVKEAGINNVGIFDPKNIRGKFAKYNPEDAESTDFMKAEGGPVQHFVTGGRALSSGLEALQNLIKAEGRTPIVPVPNRWFSQPDKFPHVQGMVNKTLENSQLPREAFHSGAFIDPRTGKVLDKAIYNDVGVLIDPETGRPMMSAGREAGIDILDPKTGSYTKSNLVRQSLFKPTGGDPMLGEMPFIATIEKGGMGHKYGLGTEYATPTEMYNTMSGANPTLRPRSRGDVFGMGDVVGQVQVGGRGEPHDVYEKLFVAPKGSDVPGVKLNKADGGPVGYAPGGKVGALTELMQLIKNQGGSGAAKRLEKAADIVPNLESKFQPQALKSAFAGDNASAVMAMKPGDFEKYAAPINHKTNYRLGDVYSSNDHDLLPKGDLDEYLNYLNTVQKSGGFRNIPFLELGKLQNRSFPNIQGHEGRHRMRALDKAGDESALVQMMPTSNLREPFPRRSQEEYLDALKKEIGNKPFVTPEQYFDNLKQENVKRGLIELPELFKKGGKVKK